MDEYSNIRRCGNLELEGKGRIDKFGQEVSIGYCSILQSVVRVFRDSVDAKEDSNTNRWGLVGNGGEEDNLKVWQGCFRKTTSSTGQRGTRATTMNW